MNGYFPGESRDHPTKFPAKQRFYADLQQLLESQFSPEQLVVMGDINISPEDCDIGIGEDNRKRWLKTGNSFPPEEREWLARLKAWGLSDSFRQLHPAVNDQFSWFDYRSRKMEDVPKRGLRIDVILASQGLQGTGGRRRHRLSVARHGKTSPTTRRSGCNWTDRPFPQTAPQSGRDCHSCVTPAS